MRMLIYVTNTYVHNKAPLTFGLLLGESPVFDPSNHPDHLLTRTLYSHTRETSSKGSSSASNQNLERFICGVKEIETTAGFYDSRCVMLAQFQKLNYNVVLINPSADHELLVYIYANHLIVMLTRQRRYFPCLTGQKLLKLLYVASCKNFA